MKNDIVEQWQKAVREYAEISDLYRAHMNVYGETWPGADVDLQIAIDRVQRLQSQLDQAGIDPTVRRH